MQLDTMAERRTILNSTKVTWSNRETVFYGAECFTAEG